MDKPLDPKDLRVILYLYRQNVHAVQRLGLPEGTPFLLTGWRAKRARRLVELGFIEVKGDLSPSLPNMTDMMIALITQSGVEAYNAAVAAADAQGQS